MRARSIFFGNSFNKGNNSFAVKTSGHTYEINIELKMRKERRQQEKSKTGAERPLSPFAPRLRPHHFVSALGARALLLLPSPADDIRVVILSERAASGRAASRAASERD